MKLAFSTLGCPDFSWPDMYAMAKDVGFSGIELRGLGDDIFSVHAEPFSKENIGKTKEKLKRLHLEIPCLSSGCALRFGEQLEENIREIGEYIRLAAQLGTPYIRILGDRTAEVTTDFDDAVVIEALRTLAPQAEAAGVMLLVETNGVYTRSCAILLISTAFLRATIFVSIRPIDIGAAKYILSPESR